MGGCDLLFVLFDIFEMLLDDGLLFDGEVSVIRLGSGELVLGFANLLHLVLLLVELLLARFDAVARVFVAIDTLLFLFFALLLD